jgi:hypothetical protein
MADIPGVAGSMEPAPDAGTFELRRHLLNPTIVETFKDLEIADLRAYADGKLAEGIFILRNRTEQKLLIPGATVFATDLALKPNEKYLAWILGSYYSRVLEVNETGKSIKFNIDVSISQKSELAFYVVANDGA